MRILKPFRIITTQFVVAQADLRHQSKIVAYEFGRLKEVWMDINLLAAVINSDDVISLRALLQSRVLTTNVCDCSRDKRTGKLITYKERIYICVIVGMYGAARCLTWLLAMRYRISEDVSRAAIRNGHHHIIELLEQLDAPIAEDLCYAAADSGMLESLKWLRSHGYSWDEDVTIAAAEMSCFKILEYLWECGGPWPQNGRIAEISNMFDADRYILKWQLRMGCPRPDDQGICEFVDTDSLLKWVVKNGLCDCDGYYHEEL